MSLIIPLGLLGLLSLIALILIYIIKPNYQQKRISSTYVWKLSLKYKKKRIPISRLSQLLIFLCQLLVLVLCALLLAKPAILEERVNYKDESVVIIDASASMMVSEGGESRFERAVAGVKEFAENVMENDGVISVIVADGEAYFVAQRSSAADAVMVADELDDLLAEGTSKCTFGSADMDGAAALAEQVLEINGNAKVYLYTATSYINKNGIEVVSVAADDDWNAAVLNCDAKVEEDNYYSITIDVGCYGKSAQLAVNCDIYGVNGNDGREENISKTVFLDGVENEATIRLTSSDFAGGAIYSFDHLKVYIDESDGFNYDNSIDYYGGKRETIKVQYASSFPNTFINSICNNYRTSFKDKWNVELALLRSDEAPALKGFDFYIFEHTMPETLPTDGVVVLIDPDKAPEGAGFRLGETVNLSSDSTLALGEEHPVNKYVNADNITTSYYKRILSSAGYDEVLSYAGDPVLIVKNESKCKIAVCTFNLNFSNVGVRKEFPTIMYNIFEYFIPSTLTGHMFEIGDTLTLNARGEDLTVNGPGADNINFETLPAQFRVEQPGTYTLTQETMKQKPNVQGVEYVIAVSNFFVKVPSFESNITKEVDALPLLHANNEEKYDDKDLLTYFAAAMVALLFVEWLLQSREYFR